MKRTLFIHVGLHKTGTTSLQRFLFENQKPLQDAGLYRPETGADNGPNSWGHHALAGSLRTVSPEAHQLWADLRKECRGQKQVVVSSEEFSLVFKPEHLLPVIRKFEKWTVRIVCYVRPQDQYLESLYNHSVKAVGETADIETFLKRVKRRLNYRAYLMALDKTFGTSNIILRPYEPDALRGDICSDFMAAIGMEMPDTLSRKTETLNPGLTAKGMELMLQANQAHDKDSKVLRLKRLAILKANAAPPHYEHSLISDERRAEIRAQYAEANAEIADRFLPGRGYLFSD